MLYLKQSTAATIKLGPFVDDSDGKTAETGLTISQADIRLSKNGGDIAQTNNSAGATHDELGYYNVPLDTTDTNTLGTLKVIVSVSGALPVFADFMVITAEAYDTLCGTDHFTVDLNGTQLAAILEDTGTTIPGLINALNDLSAQDVWEYATRTLTANTNLNIPSAADIADAVWDEAIADHTAGTTFGGKNQRVVPSETLNDYKADVSGLATSAALAIVDGKLDTVDTVVDGIQADLSNATDGLGALKALLDQIVSDLESAYTDATSLTTNSLRDRIRTLGWIIRNKMEITNANGNTVIYKDDGTTPAFSVPSAITDDSTTTTRKRME
jgi:hypothetical protein